MDWFTPFKTSENVDMLRLIQKTMQIEDVQKELIEYNQDQLQDGIDSNSQTIYTELAEEQNLGEVYAKRTIIGTPMYYGKIEKGQPWKQVTLKDTGAFYNSMQVKTTLSETTIIADFRKGDESILDNFSDKFDFLGLTEINLDSFIWLVFLDYFMQFYLKELELS